MNLTTVVVLVSVLGDQWKNSLSFTGKCLLWSLIQPFSIGITSDSYQLYFYKTLPQAVWSVALSGKSGRFAPIDAPSCLVSGDGGLCRSWPLPLCAVKPHLQVSWDLSRNGEFLLRRWVDLQASVFDICFGWQFLALPFKLLGTQVVFKVLSCSFWCITSRRLCLIMWWWDDLPSSNSF